MLSMSLDSGDITGIVGVGITGAVAIKTVDMVGDLAKGKKHKKKKRKTNSMFDVDLTNNFGDFY